MNEQSTRIHHKNDTAWNSSFKYLYSLERDGTNIIHQCLMSKKRLDKSRSKLQDSLGPSREKIHATRLG